MIAGHEQPECHTAVCRRGDLNWLPHQADLKRLAPLWLELTKAVRLNPGRYWHLPADAASVAADIETGDAYATRGQPPFLADMYGYVFAAAEIGLTHIERPEV